MSDFLQLLEYKLNLIPHKIKSNFTDVDPILIDSYLEIRLKEVHTALGLAKQENPSREFFQRLEAILYTFVSNTYSEVVSEYQIDSDCSVYIKLKKLQQAHIESYRHVLDECEKEWLLDEEGIISQEQIVHSISILKKKLLENNSISMDSVSEYTEDHNERLILMNILGAVHAGMSDKINDRCSFLYVYIETEKQVQENIALNALLIVNSMLEFIDQYIHSQYYEIFLMQLSDYFMQFTHSLLRYGYVESTFKDRCIGEHALIFLTTEDLFFSSMSSSNNSSPNTTPNTTPNPGIRKLHG